MKPRKAERPIREPNVKEAVERHKEEYADIAAAIEAMKQTQLTQAAKIRQILTPVGYRFI